MPAYKAPVRDISFVINELLESEKLYQTLPGYEEATADLMNAIVEEGAQVRRERAIAPEPERGRGGLPLERGGRDHPRGFHGGLPPVR